VVSRVAVARSGAHHCRMAAIQVGPPNADHHHAAVRGHQRRSRTPRRASARSWAWTDRRPVEQRSNHQPGVSGGRIPSLAGRSTLHHVVDDRSTQDRGVADVQSALPHGVADVQSALPRGVAAGRWSMRAVLPDASLVRYRGPSPDPVARVGRVVADVRSQGGVGRTA
jgi:hypothetical protein